MSGGNKTYSAKANQITTGVDNPVPVAFASRPMCEVTPLNGIGEGFHSYTREQCDLAAGMRGYKVTYLTKDGSAAKFANKMGAQFGPR